MQHPDSLVRDSASRWVFATDVALRVVGNNVHPRVNSASVNPNHIALARWESISESHTIREGLLYSHASNDSLGFD